MLSQILCGLVIGFALLLPGFSTGTLLVVLGFYDALIEDLARLRLKKYLPLAAAVFVGTLLSVFIIDFLFRRYYSEISALAFGLLLASVPLVLNLKKGKKIKAPYLLLGLSGFALTWFVLCGPKNFALSLSGPGHLAYFVGGALTGATILLPGFSAGAMLVVLSLYETMLHALTTLKWLPLSFFTLGFAAGLFGAARLLQKLYRRYAYASSLFLAGLVLGSTRAFWPAALSLSFIFWALMGAIPVLLLAYKKQRA